MHGSTVPPHIVLPFVNGACSCLCPPGVVQVASQHGLELVRKRGGQVLYAAAPVDDTLCRRPSLTTHAPSPDQLFSPSGDTEPERDTPSAYPASPDETQAPEPVWLSGGVGSGGAGWGPWSHVDMQLVVGQASKHRVSGAGLLVPVVVVVVVAKLVKKRVLRSRETLAMRCILPFLPYTCSAGETLSSEIRWRSFEDALCLWPPCALWPCLSKCVAPRLEASV